MTCALTEKNRPFPYLTLALTPTTIDSVVFTDSVKPAGAYAMPDLGVIAYRMTSPAAEGTGPALDLVWLSESSRLMNLRYGFAPSADQCGGRRHDPEAARARAAGGGWPAALTAVAN